MKSTVFSKYLKHMKMHSNSNWLLELLRTNTNSIVSDTVTATDENALLDNQSLGNIETPEVQYKWGRYDSYQFEENLSLVYEKIVCWKKNLFLLQSWPAGKQFIEEATKLMNQ